MLSVHQFVAHLDQQSQGALLANQQVFLGFLREEYRRTEQVKRDLERAARDHVRGQRVRVDALPDQREAAKAVLYAVMRLADRLETTAARPPSSYKVYRQPTQAAGQTERQWRTGYGGAGGFATQHDLYPRFPFVVSFTADGQETARLNVRADRLEATVAEVKRGGGYSRRYVAAVASGVARGSRLEWRVSHPAAESLACRMLLEARGLARRCPSLKAPALLDAPIKLEPPREPELPLIEVHPETIEVGETAHFDASSRETGYARVVIDGEEVARVRCWRTEESEGVRDAYRDSIRGGTIRRIAKPSGTRALERYEARVIELCDGAPGRRSERVFGRWTRAGELWLRGTADAEVMSVYSGKIARRADAVN